MAKIVTMGKARQLYEIVKKQIEDGVYDETERLPSIRALADEYQLSTNTVNTAIAMLVSEGLAVVRDGNGTYITRIPHKPKMIGVMMFDFSTGMRIETSVLESIQKNITSDYYISLFNTSNQYDVFCDGLERLIDVGAAGIIVVPPVDDPCYIKDKQRLKKMLGSIPTVFINRGIPGITADLYSVDLGKGIEDAFAYLNAIGKHHTAIILHDTMKFVNEELEAYDKVVKQYGLERDPRMLIAWNSDIRSIRCRVEEIINDIDSLIAPDAVMLQLKDSIDATGKEIPRNFSLIGINDTLISKMFNPPLTSIAFPTERIGRHAIQKLIRRIEGTETGEAEIHNYAPEFVIRKT